MTGEVAEVADVIANMQVPLHIGRPHSLKFSELATPEKRSNSASNRLELFAKRRLYVLTIGTRRSPATRRMR